MTIAMPIAMTAMTFVRMVTVMTHHSDEHRGQEHKHKCLKKGDEEFEEADRQGERGRDDTDRSRQAPTASLERHAGEHEDRCQQGVTRKHVGEETNRQRAWLDDQAEDLDDEDDRNNQQQSLRTSEQFLAAAHVLEEALHAEVAKRLKEDGGEGNERESGGD